MKTNLHVATRKMNFNLEGAKRWPSGVLWGLGAALLFMVLTTLPTQAQSGGTNDGLIAYYPFDGNANDGSGNGINGTVVGATFVPDRFGRPNSALEFNGLDNYVTMSRGLPDFTNGTFSAWLFIPRLDATARKIFFEGDFADGHDYDLTIDQEGTRFRTKDDSYLDAPALPTGRWFHLAAVADSEAGRLQLWIDGIMVAGKSAPSVANVGNHQELQLGRILYVYSAFYFNGRMDECRFYNRALQAVEIAQVYANPPWFTAQPQSQVGYWGKEVAFRASGAGPGPYAYQWLKDGTPILGATNATLTLTDLHVADAGVYSLVLANLFGRTTSSPATLTINPAKVSLNMYAGVTVDGVAGRTYVIQYVTDLQQTNNWITLTNLTLSSPVQVWFDMESPSQSKRFYRVTIP